MQPRSLPSYTTERYYLLSEIEDRSIFEPVESDEGIPQATTRVFFGRHCSGFTYDTAVPAVKGSALRRTSSISDSFYLLWDLRPESNISDELFRTEIQKLSSKITELQIDVKQSICCIEVIINEKDDWSKGLSIRVFEMVNWMKRSSFNFGCIYIGICDSVGGAPALEAILDYSKIIEDHNIHIAALKSDIMLLRVIGVNMVTLLGHDPTREPDAVSGVYQAELVFTNETVTNETHTCCSLHENSNISKWADSKGLEHTKIIRDVNGQRGNVVDKMKRNDSSSIVSLILFIFACFAAYVFQLYRST